MIAQAEVTVAGTIGGIENHGTIILLEVHTDEGTTVFVPFDQSPFRWMLDGEQCGPADLIDRTVIYNGEFLTFLEQLNEGNQ